MCFSSHLPGLRAGLSRSLIPIPAEGVLPQVCGEQRSSSLFREGLGVKDQLSHLLVLSVSRRVGILWDGRDPLG